jgi:hypothetical protein
MPLSLIPSLPDVSEMGRFALSPPLEGEGVCVVMSTLFEAVFHEFDSP